MIGGLSAVLAVFVAVMLALVPGVAGAEGTATASVSSVRIGEHFVLTIEVPAPPDATIEIDPGGEMWNGVEVVRIESVGTREEAGATVHVLEVTVAAFQPGSDGFAPAVTVVRGGEGERVQLPPVLLDVVRTLPADAPLELSALEEPESVRGAESPWLRPAIGAGVVVAVALVAAGVALAVRRLMRREPENDEAEPEPVLIPGDLTGFEDLLLNDPAKGYRALGAVVRKVVSMRYGVPAASLTTGELQSRMEQAGVDRWQARLVGGLLEECDAVVYAGYRPAAERLTADLNMAREIVEAAD